MEINKEYLPSQYDLCVDGNGDVRISHSNGSSIWLRQTHEDLACDFIKDIYKELEFAIHDINLSMDIFNAVKGSDEKFSEVLKKARRYDALKKYYAGSPEGIAWFNEEHCDRIADFCISEISGNEADSL